MAENIRIHWKVKEPINQDILNVYIIRYQWDDDPSLAVCEHLSPEGTWVEHLHFGIIQPWLSVPGWLFHQMPSELKATLEQLVLQSKGERGYRERQVAVALKAIAEGNFVDG